MNKYDFDFKRIEDVLYDVLGITNLTDIVSLKLQIHNALNSLNEAIDKKVIDDEESLKKQNLSLCQELDKIASETDLEKVLRKCITVKYLTLLSLDVKVRPSDSFEVKESKTLKRNEIFALAEFVKSVPSLLDLINQRNIFMRRVDSKNRIIQYSTVASKLSKDEGYPQNKLDIQFTNKPRMVSGEYGKLLQESGIYAYKFGDLTYSREPNENGNYTQEVTRKNLVGVIKKDEFCELKKYTILMDDVPNNAPPEFCRDILFSDMLLRNSKNNLGFLGTPKKFSQDRLYKYKITFDDIETENLLNAIHFESDPSKVQVNSNIKRIKNMKDAFLLMQEKMDQNIKEILDRDDKENIKIGDDC